MAIYEQTVKDKAAPGADFDTPVIGYARGYLAWRTELTSQLYAASACAVGCGGCGGCGGCAAHERTLSDKERRSNAQERALLMPRAGWHTHRDEQIVLQYDARLPISMSDQAGCYVLVLGHIASLHEESYPLDEPGQPDTPSDTKISALLVGQLSLSVDAFLDALDLCSGRFVCFYKTSAPDSLQVVTDATSMRSVFYCETFPGVISSHPSLLAHTLNPVIGIGLDATVQAFLDEARPCTYNMSYLPGFVTLYEHIYQLPSSNALSLTNNQITRIFPRKPRQELSLEEVVRRCSVLFRRTVESFARRYKTVASLSGGLDSRLTLAACRTSLPDVSFFCYTRAREPVNFVDVVVANQVASRLGLQIHNITFDYENPPTDSDYADLLEDLKRNNEFEHFYPLAHAYVTQMPRFELHLRSNIGEPLRAYYHRGVIGAITRGQASWIEKFAAVYCRSTLCDAHPFLLVQYQRYMRLSGLLEGRLGFDVMTLYELEESIAAWQSGVLRESDIAFETVSMFNCREVLRLFMSLPFEDWVAGRGMYGCIETLWPELLEMPINPPLSAIPDEAFERFPFIDMDVVRNKRQIHVHIEISSDTLSATARVSESFAGNSPLEYAFYIMKNGVRHATAWYSACPTLKYPLDDSMRGSEMSVRAFARHANAPDTKTSSMSATMLYA